MQFQMHTGGQVAACMANFRVELLAEFTCTALESTSEVEKPPLDACKDKVQLYAGHTCRQRVLQSLACTALKSRSALEEPPLGTLEAAPPPMPIR